MSHDRITHIPLKRTNEAREEEEEEEEDGDGATEHVDSSEAETDTNEEKMQQQLSAPLSTSNAQHRVSPLTPTAASSSSSTSASATSSSLNDRVYQDQLPPPLPLMQLRHRTLHQKEALRIPKTGLGRNGTGSAGNPGNGDSGNTPCCATPAHILTTPHSEPLSTQLTSEQRHALIDKLRIYDRERNNPDVQLSPLFINRLIYDCTMEPVFSRKWQSGRAMQTDGTYTKCTCTNCAIVNSSTAATPSIPTSNGGTYDNGASHGMVASHSFSSLRNSGSSANPSVVHLASSPRPLSSSTCTGSYILSVHPYYTPTSPSDSTLVFESRFESGNLRTVVQVSEQEYDLTIRPDWNTNHHTQWYYFSIRNIRRSRLYKFNFLNFMKSDSLYNEGMQPLMYSTARAHATGVGWTRLGTNICYYKNHLPRAGSKHKFFYTMSFTFSIPAMDASLTNNGDSSDPSLNHSKDDIIYFAQSYPYTYTQLNRDLFSIESDQHDNGAGRSQYMRRRVLCKTLAGNDCEVLTITNFDESENGSKESSGASSAEATATSSSSSPTLSAISANINNNATSDYLPLSSRRGIILTARVHPGESNSSWIMRGMLLFLTSDHPTAVCLRNKFIFKLVPMLNPDGVINGNYRCSLAGVDLNRQWSTPSEILHPTIYYTKQLIMKMSSVRDVALVVDCHGHSRKMNVFLYGCPQMAVMLNGTVSGGKGKKQSSGAARTSSTSTSPHEPNNSASTSNTIIPVDPNSIRMMERVFPKILADTSCVSLDDTNTEGAFIPATSSLFHFPSCSFTISADKLSTARVVLYHELNLLNSFTLEASFAGSTIGGNRGRQYNIQDYEQMGEHVCKAIWKWSDPAAHEEVRKGLCNPTALQQHRNSTHSADDDTLFNDDTKRGDSSDDSSDDESDDAPINQTKHDAATKKNAAAAKKKATTSANGSTPAPPPNQKKSRATRTRRSQNSVSSTTATAGLTASPHQPSTDVSSTAPTAKEKDRMRAMWAQALATDSVLVAGSSDVSDASLVVSTENNTQDPASDSTRAKSAKVKRSQPFTPAIATKRHSGTEDEHSGAPRTQSGSRISTPRVTSASRSPPYHHASPTASVAEMHISGAGLGGSMSDGTPPVVRTLQTTSSASSISAVRPRSAFPSSSSNIGSSSLDGMTASLNGKRPSSVNSTGTTTSAAGAWSKKNKQVNKLMSCENVLTAVVTSSLADTTPNNTHLLTTNTNNSNIPSGTPSSTPPPSSLDSASRTLWLASKRRENDRIDRLIAMTQGLANDSPPLSSAASMPSSARSTTPDAHVTVAAVMTSRIASHPPPHHPPTSGTAKSPTTTAAIHNGSLWSRSSGSFLNAGGTIQQQHLIHTHHPPHHQHNHSSSSSISTQLRPQPNLLVAGSKSASSASSSIQQISSISSPPPPPHVHRSASIGLPNLPDYATSPTFSLTPSLPTPVASSPPITYRTTSASSLTRVGVRIRGSVARAQQLSNSNLLAMVPSNTTTIAPTASATRIHAIASTAAARSVVRVGAPKY